MNPAILVTFIIVFIIALYIVVCIGALSFAIKRRKKKSSSNDDPEYIKRRDDLRAYLFSEKPQEIYIKSDDNFDLFARFLPSKTDSKRFVILSHGYRSSGCEDCNCFTKFYHNKLNYNVLLPDHRGHGKSSGNYICFGAHAHKDLILWINYLIKEYGSDIEIILHGVSMGAATVMLTNEIDPPSQVKLVIEDCGYTNAFEEICHVLKGMIKFNFPLLVRSCSLLCKIRAGYFFKDADPLKNMPKAKNPILFIHGGKDTFVPTYMCKKLYDACNAKKDILLIPDAAHARSYFVDTEAYENKVKNFISDNLSSL